MAAALVMVEITQLVLLPMLSALICFLVLEIGFVRKIIVLSSVITAFPVFVTALLFVPGMFVLTLALTIGGLAVNTILAVLMTLPFPALWIRNF